MLNFHGAVPAVTYTLSDGALTDTAVLSITITAVNDAPLAVVDSATTAEDTALLNIDVLGNDSDVDGDGLSILGMPTALHGPALVHVGRWRRSTAGANYNGSDTISYVVVDGNGGSDAGSVAITVTSVNDAPLGDDETFTAAEGAGRRVPGCAGG